MGKKKALGKAVDAVKDAARRDMAMSKRSDPDRAAKGVPSKKSGTTTGFMNDARRPQYGGLGYTGSKALVPVTKASPKKPMSRGKKVVIGAGIVAGAGALGNVAFPKSDKSRNKTTAEKGQAGAWNTGKSGTARKGAPAPYKPATKSSGLSASGRSYTASKGDSLWSIAEKTVPKGASVSSWWLAIKKMNTKNGKLRRLYTGTGVSLPPGARRS